MKVLFYTSIDSVNKYIKKLLWIYSYILKRITYVD